VFLRDNKLELNLQLLLLVKVWHLVRHHATNRRAVKQDVVAEELGEDPPVLETSVKHLMPHPPPGLHCPLLRWVGRVLWTLYFVGVADVLVISSGLNLNALTHLEEVP